MRTLVCIVPETGRRVTTDNGESLQRRERLCTGRSQTLQAYDLEHGRRKHVRVLPTCTCTYVRYIYIYVYAY